MDDQAQNKCPSYASDVVIEQSIAAPDVVIKQSIAAPDVVIKQSIADQPMTTYEKSRMTIYQKSKDCWDK